jgi:hypothetical protein
MAGVRGELGRVGTGVNTRPREGVIMPLVSRDKTPVLTGGVSPSSESLVVSYGFGRVSDGVWDRVSDGVAAAVAGETGPTLAMWGGT